MRFGWVRGVGERDDSCWVSLEEEKWDENVRIDLEFYVLGIKLMKLNENIIKIYKEVKIDRKIFSKSQNWL